MRCEGLGASTVTLLQPLTAADWLMMVNRHGVVSSQTDASSVCYRNVEKAMMFTLMIT